MKIELTRAEALVLSEMLTRWFEREAPKEEPDESDPPAILATNVPLIDTSEEIVFWTIECILDKALFSEFVSGNYLELVERARQEVRESFYGKEDHTEPPDGTAPSPS